MKSLLKIIGWLGIVVMSLLDIANPTSHARKPDDETVVIIGIGVCVLLLIIIIAVIQNAT